MIDRSHDRCGRESEWNDPNMDGSCGSGHHAERRNSFKILRCANDE